MCYRKCVTNQWWGRCCFAGSEVCSATPQTADSRCCAQLCRQRLSTRNYGYWTIGCYSCGSRQNRQVSFLNLNRLSNNNLLWRILMQVMIHSNCTTLFVRSNGGWHWHFWNQRGVCQSDNLLRWQTGHSVWKSQSKRWCYSSRSPAGLYRGASFCYPTARVEETAEKVGQ